MHGVDDGEDGLNDEAFDRMMRAPTRRLVAAPVPAIDDLIGMTPELRLYRLFDYAALEPSTLTLRESQRPGSVLALKRWAHARGHLLISQDMRPAADCTCHEVRLGTVHAIIVIEPTGASS